MVDPTGQMQQIVDAATVAAGSIAVVGTLTNGLSLSFFLKKKQGGLGNQLLVLLNIAGRWAVNQMTTREGGRAPRREGGESVYRFAGLELPERGGRARSWSSPGRARRIKCVDQIT